MRSRPTGRGPPSSPASRRSTPGRPLQSQYHLGRHHLQVSPVQARTWPPCWQEVAPLGPVRQKVAGTVPCCRVGWRPCSQATLLVPHPSHPGADWLSPSRTPADPLDTDHSGYSGP